jgi:hypothetical protein
MPLLCALTPSMRGRANMDNEKTPTVMPCRLDALVVHGFDYSSVFCLEKPVMILSFSVFGRYIT